ncbi:hypothetical protein chiPu_0030076, partial [Chiloscyllium punctatum]|nr:hypothetical protein [Chiloscyllium punctatum]
GARETGAVSRDGEREREIRPILPAPVTVFPKHPRPVRERCRALSSLTARDQALKVQSGGGRSALSAFTTVQYHRG